MLLQQLKNKYIPSNFVVIKVVSCIIIHKHIPTHKFKLERNT